MHLAANLVVSEDSVAIPETAVIPSNEDRESFVAMMKKELARRVDKIVVPAPVVTEDSGAFIDIDNDESQQTTNDNREVFWCDATVLEAQFVASWPAVVEVFEREGARVIVSTTPALETATGTIGQLPSPTLMQFPIRPELRAEPTCLTHGYIGVTTDGRLIHNNDVILYKSYPGDSLVGYAFDGNPIYGNADNSKLDSCGGQVTASGYRYHLRTEDNFIIGCFMSEPQQTILAG